MIPVRMLIIVFGLVLGPAVLWWGLSVLDSVSAQGANAETIMQGLGGCALIVVGGAAACVAAALVLKPIAEYLEREFTL